MLFLKVLLIRFRKCLSKAMKAVMHTGYTDTYVRIKTQSVNEDLLNTIIKVKVTGRGEGELREQ